MQVFNDIIDYKTNCDLYELAREKVVEFGKPNPCKPGFPVVNKAIHLNHDDPHLNTIIEKIYSVCPNLRSMENYTNYINVYPAGVNPYWHSDTPGGSSRTCLVYLNPKTDLDEGGETQFLIDDEIVGVLAKPGRLVVFDGQMLHKGTSFRSIDRVTLAIKFQ